MCFCSDRGANRRVPVSGLRLSSARELASACAGARSIRLAAYTLPDGPVADALCAAARRGARVEVRLDGAPRDATGGLARHNAAMLDRLRAAGARAVAVEAPPGMPAWHLKGAVLDGRSAFLDDRNWASDGRSTVLRTTDSRDVAVVASALAGVPAANRHLWTTKRDALKAEQALIAGSRTAPVAVETESFGPSAVCDALLARARAGAEVRLLVNAADRNPRRTAALAELRRAGVDVRAGHGSEKLALCGSRAWVGSANATAYPPWLPDWGATTRSPALVKALRARFEAAWSAARPL